MFEFLDHFHIYEGFFNQNSRFRQLLTHSNIPIHIDLSHLSKSACKRYKRDFLDHHIDRISSLRISNPCMHDLIFPSLEAMFPFDRLNNLILQNIEYISLTTLLDRLIRLSRLSSLTIATIDHVTYKATIYRQIFRLPQLKYCKISWSGWRDSGSLVECKDEFSTIEHLIIATSISVYELNALLSYVPQLRRLSIHLERTWSFSQPKRLAVCHQLNHLNLRVDSVRFQTLEQVFTEILPTNELIDLTLTIHDSSDDTYLNATRWEQLLTIYTPKLQIFDLHCDISAYDENSRLNINKEFSSSFWMKQKWTFAHYSYSKRFNKHILFQSTNICKYDLLNTE